MTTHPTKDLAAADLAAVLQALDQPFEQAERKLLAIGEDLGRAADILGALVALFEALPQGLEHADLRRAVDHISEVIGEIRAIAQTLGDEQAVLDRLATLADEVSKRIERLGKTVGAISVLAINARIAAAKIDGKGEDFSVFTKEIGRLAQTAVDTIKSFAAENQRLVTFLRTASANQAAFEKAHKETLRLARQGLETSLGALAERRAQAISAAKTIGQRSDHIRAGIGAVVMALQIGDITRQRLEHVAEAVHLAEDGLGPGETLSAAQRQALTGTLVRLQSVQMSRAAGEFDSEIRRIVAALGGLVADAEGILRLGVDLYGAETRTGGSFLTALGNELTGAERLIQDCAASRAEVDRIAGEAGQALGALLRRIDAVHGIEVDMRLVGLNTMLKCSRLGDEGRMLSVIAQELRSYANQTVEDARAVTEGLSAVSAAAEALTGTQSGEAWAQFSALGAKTNASAAEFAAIGATLSDALATLGRDGRVVGALLKRTIEGIDFKDAIGQRLKGIIGHLDRIAASTATDAEDFAPIRRRALDRLASRYTMASEREIHRDFVGGPLEEPAAAQDVDLFEDVLF
jgi:hypothetical protein